MASSEAGDRGGEVRPRGRPGRGEVRLGRQLITIRAEGIADHRNGRFGLGFVEAGIAKALRGGIRIEGGSAHAGGHGRVGGG